MLLVMIILLSSCRNSLPNDMPDLGMNVDELELNESIRLTVPKECNTFRSGKSVCLEVANLTGEEWDFNIKKDILIFQYENKNWERVSDKMINIGKTELTLGPTGNFPEDKDIVSVLPEVERGKSISLRIFVIVHEQAVNKEAQSKGAYVDLILKP